MADPDEPNDRSDKPLAGLNCLVLDDDLLIALDIEQLLLSAGAVAATCVGNLADAMVVLHNEAPFDIVVLDISLGAEDSMAMPAALRQCGIPFIFLTGMGLDDPRGKNTLKHRWSTNPTRSMSCSPRCGARCAHAEPSESLLLRQHVRQRCAG